MRSACHSLCLCVSECVSPPRPRCSQLRPPPPPYPCAALSLCMSLCLSLSLSERGKRKKQRFLKIFSPVILEPLTTRKVTQFVASRFSLIFSLGGSRKKLKIATKALSWQHWYWLVCVYWLSLYLQNQNQNQNPPGPLGLWVWSP